MTFSGPGCDCCVFQPLLALRQEVLAENGMVVMMTWHDVDFDWSKDPDIGHMDRCSVCMKKSSNS